MKKSKALKVLGLLAVVFVLGAVVAFAAPELLGWFAGGITTLATAVSTWFAIHESRKGAAQDVEDVEAVVNESRKAEMEVHRAAEDAMEALERDERILF